MRVPIILIAAILATCRADKAFNKLVDSKKVFAEITEIAQNETDFVPEHKMNLVDNYKASVEAYNDSFKQLVDGFAEFTKTKKIQCFLLKWHYNRAVKQTAKTIRNYGNKNVTKEIDGKFKKQEENLTKMLAEVKKLEVIYNDATKTGKKKTTLKDGKKKVIESHVYYDKTIRYMLVKQNNQNNRMRFQRAVINERGKRLRSCA